MSGSSLPDRTRLALERAAAAAERRKKEPELSPPAPKKETEAGPSSSSAPSNSDPSVSSPSSSSVAPSETTAAPSEPAVSSLPDSVPVVVADPLPFVVGQDVYAQWSEDLLFYRARVDSASRNSDGQVVCDVTFVEYGNAQKNTLGVLSIAAFDEMMQRAAAPTSAQGDGEESSGESVDDESLEMAAAPAKKVEERWSLEDRSPASASNSAVEALQRQHQSKNAKVVGKNADGTPIYMTEREAAALRQRKKQDKAEQRALAKEKVKKGVGGLFKKKEAEQQPAVSIEPVTAWTQKTAPMTMPSPPTSPRANNSGTSASPPPVPPPPVSKLSPRRLPPAPPVAVKEEVLVPLPPISIPSGGNVDSLSIGHVFCVLGDLKQVNCDAWLVPSTRDNVPEQSSIVSKTARARQYAGVGASGLKYFGTKNTVTRAPGWPDENKPIPYLAHLDHAEFSVPLKQYLELACVELTATKPRFGRSKHLLSVPLLPCMKSAVLLPLLLDHVRARNVDIVVVTLDRSLLELLQVARLSSDSFPTLAPSLRLHADELALLARNHRLSICIGMPPSLSELLEKLDLSLAELSVVDQMQLACARLGGASAASSKCGVRLVHNLIASLQCLQHVVCATADDRFSEACAANGSLEKKTVLRLNGDLLGAGENNLLPLQSSPHHVLFVGCGASAVDAIRVAKHYQSHAPKKWATLLAVQSNPAWKDIAGPGVEVVAMSENNAKGSVDLEIFLDYLNARSASIASHIFAIPEDDLSPGNKEFRSSLLKLMESLSPEAKASEAGTLFITTIKDLFLSHVK